MDEITDDSASDRAVYVLPPDEHGWVAIYDEATESQESRSLLTLASTASRALDAPAFAVSVHDSDVLELALFEHGNEVDRYNSAPDYFGGKLSKSDRARVAGQPERWASLLVANHAVSELQSVWHAEDLFAERTLVRTCELIGCDPKRASVGYRYALQDALAPGTVTLRFRARARPAYEEHAGGPPSFRSYSPGDRASAQFAVGDELRVGVTVQSAGAASKGLLIIVWGAALDTHLVTVEHIELVLGDPRRGNAFTRHVPVVEPGTEGESLLVVDLPEQAIPAGLPGVGMGFTPGVDIHKAMGAMFATHVHANVTGRVERAGHADLSVAFVPHGNRAEGALGASYDLVIDPPMPRPFRARAETGRGATSHQFRPLVGERFLVGLVAIDADRAHGAAYARDAIDAALALVGTSGNVQTTVYRPSPQRPKTGRGKVATQLRGKRYDAVIESMTSAQVVDLSAREGPDFDPEKGPLPAKWGVTFGTDILGRDASERVPTLSLWADTEALGVELSTHLEARWSDVIARAMERDGLQGVVLRGGWPAGGTVDYTAYETACGVGGMIATTRAWLTRWVRVPGNHRLWLGPALAARLDAEARAKLATIADLATNGASLSLTLRQRSDARAFEEALADILPAEADAHAATRAWYDEGRV